MSRARDLADSADKDFSGTVTVDNLVVDGDATLTGAASNVVWDNSDNALEFADNAKAIFGAGSDLQIYHNGSNSFIDDSGTGNLQIRGTQIKLQKYTGENMFVGISDGAASMYYDNAQKIATTATGVDVTGTLTATTLTGTLSTAAQPNITSVGTLTALTGGTGDLNWDSGTLFVDSSASAVGIGTTSPTQPLNVLVPDNSGIQIESAAGHKGYIFFGDEASNTVGRIGYDHATDAMGLWTAGAEVVVIDSTGIDVTGTVTATGTSVFASLDISGDVDVDGTLETDNLTVGGAQGSDGQVLTSTGSGGGGDDAASSLTSEQVQDIAGAMFSSNTESGITATYQDADGTIDLTVGTLNQNTTGSAATLTTARAIAVAGAVTGTANFNGSAGISITTTLANDAVNSQHYADNSIDALHLNVSGNGSTSQFLRSDGDGTFTWATPTDTNTTYSVGDGGLSQINFTSADHTKLNGIETGATADQTAAQILTAIKTVDGGGSGLDADLLDGISSGSFLRSDATDTFTTLTGTTLTVNGVLNVRNAIDLADNDIVRFGSSDDVELFFSGSHFYMDLNSGGNNFYIRDGTATRFTFDDAGHFTATGNVTAYSDKRLKENIKPIEGAINKVQQISGNTYTRNDLKDPSRSYAGVIAQEVEVVLPEAVSESEDGIKTVDYNSVIALLIESVKELKTEVDDLKNQLDESK